MVMSSKSFSEGDDIYLKCGSTFTGTKLENSSFRGVNEVNRSTLGSYYSAGTIGVSGAKPIINGGLNVSAWTASGIARGAYVGMIQIQGTDYVTVENINIIRSGGQGIRVYESDYVTIRNVDTQYTYRKGIDIAGSAHAKVIHNTTYLSSLQRAYDEEMGLTQTYSGGIGFVPSDSGVSSTFGYAAYNKISLSRGEGFDIIKGTEDTVVEYNTIQNTQSTALYFDRGPKRCDARYNLIYCPARSDISLDGVVIWRSSTECAFGVGVADETDLTGTCTDLNIHGNIIINQKGGIGVTTPSQHGINYTKAGISFTNNTIINSVLYNALVRGGIIWESPGQIKNNIFICTGEAGYCTNNNITVEQNYGTNFPWDYNIFYENCSSGCAKDINGSGSHDITANPLLSKMTDLTRAAVNPDSLNIDDFLPQAGSPAVDVGANLGATYDDALLATSNYQSSPIVANIADQDSHGSGWEIGAVIRAASENDTTAPANPNGLSVR
jgi:hypothetical protein